MPLKQTILEIFETEFQKSAPNVITNLAEATNALAIDIYSENKRFIFELIQNADDAAFDGKSVSVKIHLVQDYLIISHDGRPFSERDVRGICGIGYGTKRDDPTKTGYKGIGFKSVFGQQAGWVCVKSGEEFFAFDKHFSYWDEHQWGSKDTWEEKYGRKFQIPWQLVPVYKELEELPDILRNRSLFEGFNVSTIIKIGGGEKLEHDIRELLTSPELILFLRSISQIEFESSQSIRIEKLPGQYEGTTELWLDGEVHSTWLLSNQLIDVDSDLKERMRLEQKSPDKLLSMQQTEVSLAAKINKETGRIEPLEPGKSIILTYLPTKVAEFNLPILCNGNFLLDAGREYFHEDREWNKWVFEKLGIEIFKWIKLISETPQIRPQILHLLPPIPDQTSELKSAFAKGIQTGLNEVAFLPGWRRLLKVGETLVDFTGLSRKDFVPLRILIEYINNRFDKQFSEDSILDNGLEKVTRLKKYGVFFFELEHLKDFFLDPLFLQNHSLEKNFQLIAFFFEQAKKRKEWNEDLKSIPFIFDQTGALRSPNTIFFEVGEDLDVDANVIHPDVFAQIEMHPEIKDWLEGLGIGIASNESFIRRVILSTGGSAINQENAIHYVRLLYKSYKIGEVSSHEVLQCQSIQLLTKKGTLLAAGQCYLPDKYHPVVGVESFLEKDIFVSEDYCFSGESEKDWGAFFILLGVKEKVEVISEPDNITVGQLWQEYDSQYFSAIFTSIRQYGGFGTGSHNLVVNFRTISFLEDTKENYQFANYFWTHVINKSGISFYELTRTVMIYYGVGYGRNGYVEHCPNYVNWFVANTSCIPSNLNTCHSSTELFVNDPEIINLVGNYLPVVDFKFEIPKEWRDVFHFRTALTIPQLLELLKSISLDRSTDGSVIIENKKRIEKIYELILSSFTELVVEQLNEIRLWGEAANELLATDSLFYSTEDLFFYKHSHKDALGDDFNLIYAPAEIRRHESAESFYQLLGVKIINENNFALKVENERVDEALPERFIRILPFLIVLAREKDNLEKTFERFLEKVQACNFYACAEIELTFEGKSIRKCRALLQKADENTSLYFRDNWRSRLTLMELPAELCGLLDISKRWEKEIQFLLVASDDEIKEWIGETMGQGFLELILASPVWERISEIYPPVQTATVLTAGIGTISTTSILDIPVSPIGGIIIQSDKPTTIEEKIEAVRKTLYEHCISSGDLTFGWLRYCLEYEYLTKINQNQKSKRIRFKTVEYQDSYLILKDPDAETIDPELYYLKDTTPEGVELRIRNPRTKGIAVPDFRIVRVEEFEVWCKAENIRFPFSETTTATITLPADDFLLKMLKEQVEELIDSNGIADDLHIQEYFRSNIPAAGIRFLFGPPGTGKTTTISHMVVETLRQTYGKKILILTPTNRAADVVIEKIQAIFQVEEDALQSRVFRLDGHSKIFDIHQPHSVAIATTIHRFLFDRFDDGFLIQKVDWDYLIFDEASMLPLPYLLNVLFRFTKFNLSIETVSEGLPSPCLISGDPFQIMPVGLTPTFPDLIDTNEKLRGWSSENIYTLLAINKFYLTNSPKGNPYPIERLMIQYRSFPSIGHFFGRYLYTDEVGRELLQHHKTEDKQSFSIKEKQLRPLSFIQFDFKMPADQDDQNVMNVYEFGVAKYHVHSAILASKLAIDLAVSSPEKSIAIVSPYSRQAKICHKLVSKYNAVHEENPILASTIHSAQGSEADVVIFLLNPGSLRGVGDDKYATGSIAHFNNPNILNVGISRAREVLIVLHPEDKFEISPPYAEYEFNRNILQPGVEGLSYECLSAESLEQLLFVDTRISHFTQVESLASFDFYYMKELQQKAMQFVFLRNKSNLNVLIVNDLNEPVKENLTHTPEPRTGSENGNRIYNHQRRFKPGNKVQASVSGFDKDGWTAFLTIEGYAGTAIITKKNLFDHFVKDFQVKRIEDFLEIGQKIEVEVISVTPSGNLFLSKKHPKNKRQ